MRGGAAVRERLAGSLFLKTTHEFVPIPVLSLPLPGMADEMTTRVTGAYVCATCGLSEAEGPHDV